MPSLIPKYEHSSCSSGVAFSSGKTPPFPSRTAYFNVPWYCKDEYQKCWNLQLSLKCLIAFSYIRLCFTHALLILSSQFPPLLSSLWTDLHPHSLSLLHKSCSVKYTLEVWGGTGGDYAVFYIAFYSLNWMCNAPSPFPIPVSYKHTLHRGALCSVFHWIVAFHSLNYFILEKLSFSCLCKYFMFLK